MTEKQIKELRDKYKDGIPQEVIEQTAEKITDLVLGN